jgi:ribonucleoside-diphosphate reductase alpha chain
MFLDDTACNLASLNLLTFRKHDDGSSFDVAAYEHASRLWTVVLEISVMMAQFPSKEIAELSYEFRTLGLGYANIGGLLMNIGPRSLRQRRRPRLCGALTAIMTGVVLRHLGRDGQASSALPRLRSNREHMLRVIRNHRRAAHGEAAATRPAVAPVALDTPRARTRPGSSPRARLGPRARARREARLPQRPDDRHRADRHDRPGHGLRHHRHRARLRAGEVQEARRRRLLQDHQPVRARGAAPLGYAPAAIEIVAYAVGHGTLKGSGPASTTRALIGQGLHRREIAKIEAALPTAFDIKFAFNKWTSARTSAASARSASRRAAERPGFDLLSAPRLHQGRDRAANDHVCGAMTLEGAPHLKAEHLPVFDCANPAARSASASVGREPHPHDGGGAALHLGRDLQDHQHAERRHRSRTARTPTCCPGSWR